ncbi:Oxysterol-binding protein-related protein 4C [Linum grandiflorum]
MEEKTVVLTKPMSVDGDDDADSDYRTPNIVQRILSLFKHVRPGSELTGFQLPPSFNYPKSQLQLYGESVYSAGKDMLGECNEAVDPLERFTKVVSWSISTTRPSIFGVAPYNPILGETHHVSSRSLNLRLEQVSHHPPITALHATDQMHNLSVVCFHRPVPRFLGTKVEVEVQGKRILKLMNHDETYVMNSPNLLIKFLPPSVDWVGTVDISCQQTGYEARLTYTTSSLMGRASNNNGITGKIYKFSPSTSSRTLLCTLSGHWTSSVKIKDQKGERVIYSAKEVASKLKAPVLKDPQKVLPSESTLVWSEVSRAIMSKNWDKAKEAKRAVEEKQREIARERRSRGENWVPKYFTPSSKDDEYFPTDKLVPPAPIVVPL